MEIETPTQNQETPSSDRPRQSPQPTSKQSVGTLENKKDKVNHSSSIKIVNTSDRVAKVAKKEPEFGKVNGDDLADEIGEWEI